jgi:hypothetical protein
MRAGGDGKYGIILLIMLKIFKKNLPKQPKYFNIYKYKLSLRVYMATISSA